MDFSEHIRLKKVKKGKAYPYMARELMQTAREEINLILLVEISDANSSFYFKGVYGCLIAALQSFMSLEGYKPYSHEAIIQFGLENGIIDQKNASKIK
jgi:hypothetical protein